MNLHFFKYQGAGNDFIIIDARINCHTWEREDTLVKKLCDRRFGIGADGLMLLKSDDTFDFEMVYYNADGRLGSMCGNGGRCITAFARDLSIIREKAIFNASDGPHRAAIKNNWVSLQMIDVSKIEKIAEEIFVLNTGSPHYVKFVKDVRQVDVFKDGKSLRYNEQYGIDGINVNFVQEMENYLKLRTYERGVENETYACGTGATAVAMSYAFKNNCYGKNEIAIEVEGGKLEIAFNFENTSDFKDVYLSGPAVKVYEGEIII